MANPTRKTLISAAQNLHAGDCELTGKSLTPGCDTPWSVRLLRLHGGKQQGVDLILIDNGVMTIRLCPTRGMGIIDVSAGDLRLGWDSPVKEIVHPAFMELGRRRGFGWLEGFNEFVVRCGLEQLGPPGEDSYHGAVGEPPVGDLTLHGKIANTPASEVEVEVLTQAPYTITVRGIVNEFSMFGPKLSLSAELSIDPGSNTFEITDTITNKGGQTQEMALLYHINQGRPLLEDGARFVADVDATNPRDAGYSEESIRNFKHFGPPVAGVPEQCFYIDLPADSDGRVNVALHNAAKDRGVAVSWPKAQLPHFALWKALMDERDAYVTGLEPCVTLPNPRPVEREAGRLVKLDPEASYVSSLRFDVLMDAPLVQSAAASIHA